MKSRLPYILVLTAILMVFFPTPARADGIIIPEPPICDPGPCLPPPCPGPFPCPPPSPMAPLVIRYHRVSVKINEQIAVTRVDQVFYNPNRWAVEGTYLFPLPAGAAVSSFSLWVDGEPLEGQILDAAKARETYLQIVNSLRDPALLEYAGGGAVQARIFPIPPAGERRIELEYVQFLESKDGLVRYIYPLSTEKFSAWPLEQVTINVEVESSAPIRALYSPTHEISVNRMSLNRILAGYEASQVLPSQDFAVYYSLGDEQALHLLSYRDPADKQDQDGYFLLLLAPRPRPPETPLAKDVLLVLDRSGSMEGEKFRQAQEALRYILRRLNPEDRFNIVTFSTGIETFAARLQPAGKQAEALAWVDRLSAAGSTDIQRALLEAAALAEDGRPTYLIFLTDGLPTMGVVESEQILADFRAAAPEKIRLFSFGLGYDVDTFLLDSLTQEHRGLSSYVRPGEALDEVVSGFYASISTPVLTDLKLDFGTIPVYDLYPSPLPDLFSGSQIVLAGRYRQAGATTIRLKGEVNRVSQVFEFPAEFARAGDSQAEPQLAVLPRLWATRKIGYLLNQIRLQGADQETIDQVVKLSIRYGIITPYTSFLVTEADPLSSTAQERIAGEQFNLMQGAPAPISGQEAVEKAADQGSIAAAQAPAAPEGSAASQVRVAGGRTYLWNAERWVDTAFDPGSMQAIPVVFLTSDYFRLAERSPEAAAALALGPRVIFFIAGAAYEVAPAGMTAEPPGLPTSGAPATPADSLPDAVPPVSQTPARQPATGPCPSGVLAPGLIAVGGWYGWRRRKAIAR